MPRFAEPNLPLEQDMPRIENPETGTEGEEMTASPPLGRPPIPPLILLDGQEESGGLPPVSSETPTATPTQGEARRNGTKIIKALLRALFNAGDRALTRAGRQLRPPTDEQLDGIARPAAAIIVRHVPLHLLSADLADAATIAGNVSDWLGDGPVAPPRYPPIQHLGGEPDPAAPADVSVPEPGPDPDGGWAIPDRDPHARVTYQEG